MAHDKIKEVDKEKPIVEQLEKDIAPFSVNLLLQDQMGLPVNADRVKNAKFVLNQIKAHRTMEKEAKLQALAEKKFNFNVLSIYGSQEQKDQVKGLISKSIDKIKFIE